MKLFSVTENYEGRRCHWYVCWRRHELANVPVLMQEFFTKQEATTFVKFARRYLEIPHLTVRPVTALPTKSFEDRVLEAGVTLAALKVGSAADAEFEVGCFEEGDRNPGLVALEAALEELEKAGLIDSSLDAHGVRLYRATPAGMKFK
jgi:hypothetical protein